MCKLLARKKALCSRGPEESVSLHGKTVPTELRDVARALRAFASEARDCSSSSSGSDYAGREQTDLGQITSVLDRLDSAVDKVSAGSGRPFAPRIFTVAICKICTDHVSSLRSCKQHLLTKYASPAQIYIQHPASLGRGTHRCICNTRLQRTARPERGVSSRLFSVPHFLRRYCTSASGAMDAPVYQVQRPALVSPKCDRAITRRKSQGPRRTMRAL